MNRHTPRRDADRPLVRCRECASFNAAVRLCPTAKKVFVVRGTTTCLRFTPMLGAPATKRPAPDQRHASLSRWTLNELRAALAFEELESAVAELGVDADGSVRLRFAADVDVETMNAVGCLVALGTLGAGRDGSR